MAVAFDTLKLARRLEAAGFSIKQAQDTAEAFGDVFTDTIATKADIEAVRADLRELELRIRAGMAELRTDMAALRAELIKWVVGIGVAAVIAVGGMVLSATIAILRAVGHG